MKASFHYLITVLVLFFFCSAVQKIAAQDAAYDRTSEMFSRGELAQMLAPVALYPDVLLSQVLMASTYPLEVIEADRWVRKNTGLTGTDLDVALLDKDWEPSVKALCHFPRVLELMSDRISQTADIGNAFLAQEEEVMDVIQELREQAYTQGNLVKSPEQKVITRGGAIIIEPVDPRVVYVPYYDSVVIYGPWGYPDYPPYSWKPGRIRIVRGIAYWPRYYLGYSFGTWSVLDWQRSFIYIDVHKRPKYIRHDRWRRKPGRWVHDTRHRHGVSYHETFIIDRHDQHHRRTRDEQHERHNSRQQHFDSKFYVPDRSIPRDLGRKYQVPDRTMPWENDSAGDYESGRRDREKTFEDRGSRHRERDERQYRHRRDSDAVRRSREGDDDLRPLWNMGDFSGSDDNSSQYGQSNGRPGSDVPERQENLERRGGSEMKKNSGGIRPHLRVR